MSNDCDPRTILAQQMAALEAAAPGGEIPEYEREIHEAVRESVRATYLARCAGPPPESDAGLQFVFFRADSGTLSLRQGSTRVPVDEDYLDYILVCSGLRLEPGQTLLLQPRLAKRVIEESLWTLQLEAALTRGDSKAHPPGEFPGPTEHEMDLITAKLLAEELVERWKV